MDAAALKLSPADSPLALRRKIAKHRALTCIDTALARSVGVDCTRAQPKSSSPSTAATAAPADFGGEIDLELDLRFASEGACSSDSSPAPRLTLLQRRLGRKPGLTIDCSAATETDRATNPLLNPDCEVSHQYDVLEELGHGSVGAVHRGRRKFDGRDVALKLMRISDEEMLGICRDEFDLLRSVQHPHIIRALDFFVHSAGAVLVLDFFDGRTLDSGVRAVGKLSEDAAKRPFAALAGAVAHLHSVGIIHRDIKAQNVLVSHDFQDLRLVDFNTARRVCEGALSMTGTCDWLPPEVLLGSSPAEGSDLWGIGLCLFFMLTGSLPVKLKLFGSHAEFGHALASHFGGSPTDWDLAHLSQMCKAVLIGCLKVEPDLRMRAADVLASEWLSDESVAATS
eukprot:TRINITY_DN57513_c0_g1_i1.p1 TRINITY_DN57513_c0_g1~~TRINITY_DN57513_c0_g1_i1.p1  ORF type:complete len:397 (-),score=75.68 TRINITY_DN57513_c0_g1_i1:22-1212(-)